MFSIFLGRCCHIFTFLRELFTISYLYLYLLFVLLVCSQYIYISYLPTNTNFVWMNEPNNKENKNFANVNLSIDRAPQYPPPPLTKKIFFVFFLKYFFPHVFSSFRVITRKALHTHFLRICVSEFCKKNQSSSIYL